MGKWVVRYTFEDMSPIGGAVTAYSVRTVDVNGCWRVTFILVAQQLDAFYIDGIPAMRWGFNTGGVPTNTVMVPIGGVPPVDGVYPLLVGQSTIRFDYPSGIVIQREYVTWEE